VTSAPRRGRGSSSDDTSAHPVDLVVTELAVIAFPEGRAALVETAPGVTVEQVLAATEAELVVAEKVPQMAI
jgi:acetate CoA/acetoacetate CoA-transferase beta subunit